MNRKRLRALFALVFASVLAVSMIACEEKGIGDDIEDAADEIGDEIEDAVE